MPWRHSIGLRAALTSGGVAAALVVGGGAWLSGCGRACRTIDVRPLDVSCSADATFHGELHFDRAATFTSFLAQQCVPGQAAPDTSALVDDVDFDDDAVFVASDSRLLGSRCLGARDVVSVEVCDDGLQVSLRDVLQAFDPADTSSCPGRWTFAFALPRAELRAALAAGDAQDQAQASR